MAESTTIKFTFNELTTLMVKQQGIREGYWGVYVKFGIAGANMGPDEKSVVPTALVPLLEMGLQKFEGPGPLAIDAASVWAEKQKP